MSGIPSNSSRLDTFLSTLALGESIVPWSATVITSCPLLFTPPIKLMTIKMDRPLIILLFLRKSENECKFFAVVGPFEDLLILCKYPKLIPILFKSARYIYKPFASSIDTISWFKYVKPWNCVKRLKRELCRRQCRLLFVVFSEHWKISYAKVISQFYNLGI